MAATPTDRRTDGGRDRKTEEKDRQGGSHTDGQTGRELGRLADRGSKTANQTEGQRGREVGRHAGRNRQPDRRTNRQTTTNPTH